VAGGSASTGGGALELLRRRKAVEYVRLGAWMLVVTAACSGRTSSRRIGGGKPAAALDSAARSGSAGAGGRGSKGEACGRLSRAAFIGRGRKVPLARTPRQGCGGTVEAMASHLARWASRGPAAGPAAGRGEMGWAIRIGQDR
jgi:hypothetical protein